MNEKLPKRLVDGLRRRLRRLRIDIASRTRRYDRWKQVEWFRVERLVFVCSGNICRSPFAEAIAIRSRFKAISCGTTARGGAPADASAIKVADRFEIDLRPHLSLRLQDVEVLHSDLIVIMDVSHLQSAREVADPVGAQVTMLGLWDGMRPVVIPDPFGRQDDEFQRCFERICRCMDKMLHS